MSTLALIALLLGVGGCSHDERAYAVPFAQHDSAGIVLSVTAGSVALAPMGWEVDSVPDLVIGGEDSVDLFLIVGAKQYRDGRLLIVDGGTAELRIFDSRGRLLRRAGGRGNGPGEFQSPVFVPWTSSDSLLFFDGRLRRLSLFSSDGEIETLVSSPGGWPHGSPRAAIDPRTTLLWVNSDFMGGEAALQEYGLHQILTRIFWFDPTASDTIAIDSFVVDWRYRFRDQSAAGASDIPFAAAPSAAVVNDGVLITHGRFPEIREHGLDGRMRRILRVDEPGRPVTRDLIEARLDRRDRGDMPVPDTLPFFDNDRRALRLDSHGWLWARLHQLDATLPQQWVIFDPEGRARGTVRTPAGLTVHDIGSDHVIGVWRDELGVEYVRRHPLRRDVPGVGGRD